MSYRHKHIKPKIRSLKKKKRLIQRPWFWIVLLVLIVIGSIFYFVFLFPKFQITKINILGNEQIQAKDIEYVVWQDLSKNIFSKSIFTIDSKRLIKDILNKFPGIEDIKVEKKWPQDIILKIKERQVFASFCENDNCFSIDNSGVIFEKLEGNSQNMILRKELGGKEIFLGEKIVEKNIIDIISKVENDLKNNFQINIKEVLVSNFLIFKTSENWQIYFDPSSDINLQITKMNILLKDEIPATARKNIQYMYLQYKDRAYYK